jgi:hypothetical protein
MQDASAYDKLMFIERKQTTPVRLGGWPCLTFSFLFSALPFSVQRPSSCSDLFKQRIAKFQFSGLGLLTNILSADN